MTFLRHPRQIISKMFTFFAVLIPFLVFAEDLPDFGDSAGSIVSPEYERRLGKMFLSQVRQFTNLNKDPEVKSYIQSLGNKLASHSDNPEQPFNFFVVNNAAINAFAGPGGMIGMNSGVILSSNNESELAGVMAHEITHVTQRHLARQFENASKYSLINTAALIGAILIGISNPEAGIAAMTGAAGLSAQNSANFTRANEQEADRIGMQVLASSGFNPRGMPAFFETLQQLSRYSQSAAPEFVRTHPLTTSRIADTRARAEEYPKGEFTNTRSYDLIRYKLFVASSKSPKEAGIVLRQALDENKSSVKENLPIRYGLAYAYINTREFDRAQQQVDHLLKDNPDDIAYLLLAAKLETAQSNYNAAFNVFKKAYGLYPDYRPVVMAYSKALLDVSNGQEARKILKNYERHHEHDVDTYSLLGQAEGLLGNEVETAFLQSKYYFLAGATAAAADKLTFIKQQYQLDYYQEQRINAWMAELEYELELEKGLSL
ncbi:MAG: putative Zn-dependent protease [Gammaproteobacteria bacterium]|jgi:predicted Zn-dependent protease